MNLRDLLATEPTILSAVCDGDRAWTVRCHAPFVMPAEAFTLARSERALATRAAPAPGGEGGEGGEDGAPPAAEESILEGIASSTSVDFFGTEMSRECLDGMAAQFKTGTVAYVPTHDSEWDETIGTCVDGWVEGAEVENPAEGTEAERHFVLWAVVRLDLEEGRAQALVRRLKKRQRIGQSIGGWLKRLRIMEDGEGNIDRVIIDEVELDHLAATRAPANPDSWVTTLRSALAAALPIQAALAPEESAVERAVVPHADLPLADPDEPWAFGPEEQNEVLGSVDEPDWARYKKAHLWWDGEGGMKSAYKLPVAKMVGGALKYVRKGAHAAMSVLNGGRGGVDIPDSDRDGAYARLKRLYKAFGEEAPDLTDSAPPPAVQAAEPPPDAPPGEAAEAPPLDAARGMGHDEDTTDSHAAEGDLGSGGRDERANPQEIAMDREEMQALLAGAVAPLATRLQALEERASPPGETPAQELERLREEVAALKTGRRARRFVEDPIAVGGPKGAALLDSAVEATDKEGTAPTCVAMLRERTGMMDRFKAPLGNPKLSRGDVENDLHAMLAAAEDDGLIRDGTNPLSASWA